MAEKKVKVRVLNATVDGKGPGELITISEKSAQHLESIRYVARVGGADNDSKDDDKKGE